MSDKKIVQICKINGKITLLYLCVFQRRVFSQTLAMVSVLCVGWVYFTVVIPSGEAQLSQLGLACSVFTISMYLSPLADLVSTHIYI